MAREDLKWAMEHAQEYPGCWLAVKDGALLVAAQTLPEVLEVTRALPGGEKALLVDPWWTGDREIVW